MGEALDFTVETAHRAGRLLREYFHRHHTVRSKSSAIDLVTEADVASERLIVEAIHARYPEHRILSEEGLGNLTAVGLGGESAPFWMVDPLDGTVNYAHGYEVWAVSMALAQGGQVVLGVSYDPLRDETFWAERGGGAFGDGRPLRVSEASTLGQSLLATGFPYSRATEKNNNLAEFSVIMPRVQGVRRAGAAVLDLAHVAAGRLDGYWELWLHPWDWAAGWLMVVEAGGRVTGIDSAPWTPGMSHMAATNGWIHEELLDVLKSARG